MKRTFVLEAALFAVAFGISVSKASTCDDKAGTVSGTSHAAASITDTKMAGETKAASEKESASSQEQFKNDMEKELARLKKEMSALSAKVSKATGEARVAMSEKLKNLEVKSTELSHQLQAASKTSGRAWAKMQSGLERAFAEIAAGYNRAQEEWQNKQKE
jgi:hypothetical protein